jgi:hypothetical protein
MVPPIMLANVYQVGQECILRADCIGALWAVCPVAASRLKIGRRMQSCPTCAAKGGMVIS